MNRRIRNRLSNLYPKTKVEDSKESNVQPKKSLYIAKSFEEAYTNPEKPPTEYIANGILFDSSRLCIVGDSKVGKSCLTIGLAIGLALGRDYIDFEVLKALPVLYINAELGTSLFEDRIKRITEFTFDATSVPNFSYLTLLGSDAPAINTPEGAQVMKDIIEAQLVRPKVVVLDCRWKFTAGDPNKEEFLKPFCSALDNLTMALGVVFIVVHHHGYYTLGSGAGSSSWDRWVNTTLDMTPQDWKGTKKGMRPTPEMKIDVGGNYTEGETMYIYRDSYKKIPVFVRGDDTMWQKEATKKDGAKNFIIQQLIAKPQAQDDVWQKAQIAGIKIDTFSKALKELRNSKVVLTGQDDTRQGNYNTLSLNPIGAESTELKGGLISNV